MNDLVSLRTKKNNGVCFVSLNPIYSFMRTSQRISSIYADWQNSLIYHVRACPFWFILLELINIVSSEDFLT